jgi:lipopolysaccharide/colanic/teichoic acid biosynthesis glycosyltransferase
VYAQFLKPVADLFFALVAIIILSPIWLIVLVLLFISNGGQPFFVQARPGKGGKIFHLIKFKTMNDRKDKNGQLLPDAERLTKVGKFIRKTSLDELPQLVNIIRGEMSFVGPRPLLIRYLDRYNEEQKRRHEVMPGITGWVQVNGRNSISWEEKFQLDVWYVDHQSFLLDLRILLLTIVKVFRREGINQQGHATVEEFMGNK